MGREKDLNIVLQEAAAARMSLPRRGTVKAVAKGRKIRMPQAERVRARAPSDSPDACAR